MSFILLSWPGLYRVFHYSRSSIRSILRCLDWQRMFAGRCSFFRAVSAVFRIFLYIN